MFSSGSTNRVYIGTSGWSYDHWKEVFYEKGCSKSNWLKFYGKYFDSVELNSSFYRSIPYRTYENWRGITPNGFIWSVKANRYITHIKRLRDVAEPLKRFLGEISGLKEKLGPILFQLPPTLAFEEEAFDAFCSDLPRNKNMAVEARHPSWLEERALSSLRKHDMAWCISDTAGRYPYLEAVTAHFVYIRLHGSKQLYVSEYSEDEIKNLAEKITQWNKETYVYFDNDAKGHAPKNALKLKEILSQVRSIQV
jgi:uncharacterized protein YecE (DUF72 family)